MAMIAVRQYCEKYGDLILVRFKLDGKWGNYKLTEIPHEDREDFIRIWEGMEFVPSRILTEEERLEIRQKGGIIMDGPTGGEKC
jgi:hypothetical protein